MRTRDGKMRRLPPPGSEEELHLLAEEKCAEAEAYQVKTEEIKKALNENQATFERLTDSVDTSDDDLWQLHLSGR